MDTTAFSQEQYDKIYPEGIEKHYWTLARNKIIYHLLKRLKAKNKTILEIGCGKGVVVNYLIERGLNCHGVELAPVKPLSNLTQQVKTGVDAFTLPQNEREKYEIVLLLDVIEHIEQPADFIKKAQESFPNASTIVFTVPARQELFSNYDKFNGHFKRYNKQQLAIEIAAAGLKPSKVKYLFPDLYLPAKISLKLFKERETEILAPKSGFEKFIHWNIATSFFIRYFFYLGIIPGTSVIGVGRK